MHRFCKAKLIEQTIELILDDGQKDIKEPFDRIFIVCKWI